MTDIQGVSYNLGRLTSLGCENWMYILKGLSQRNLCHECKLNQSELFVYFLGII